jgi:hypothetical protein
MKVDKKIIIGSLLLLIGLISLLISALNTNPLGDVLLLVLNPYVFTCFSILFFYVGMTPEHKHDIFIIIGLIFIVFSLVLINTTIPWVEAATVLSITIVVFWTFIFIIPVLFTRNRDYGLSKKQKYRYAILPLTTFWLLIFVAVNIAFGQADFWLLFTNFFGVALFLSILGSSIIMTLLYFF